MKFRIYLALIFFIGAAINLSFSQCNADDYQALRAIYLNTNGPASSPGGGWLNAADWQAVNWSDPTTPPAGCDLCVLDGITCNGAGRVTIVHLSNTNTSSIGDPVTNLTGSLPSQIGLLTALETFNIGNSTQATNPYPKNMVGGNIPPQFHQCSQLKKLILNSNELLGIIPASIFTLIDLEVLNLSSNDLIGPLSASIGNLIKLSSLSLGYNTSFTGGIPTTIGSCVELRTLNMENCGLDSGPIPSQIGSCVELTQFIIRNNPAYSGQIPSSMNTLPSLMVFWGNNCNFNGIVPTFAGCPAMKRIHLSQNDFPGQSLPLSWANLSDLTYIGIGFCDLQGTIPTTYGNLINLTDFYINGNFISGSLPTTLSACNQMKNFNVSDNPQLTGSLHAGYGAWSSLVNFRAKGCNFTGSVPVSYSNWTNCKFFTIGGNNLGGPVPNIFGSMNQLHEVRIDSNSFTGSMPVSLASPDSLKELFIQECGLTGCFDPALNYLCGTLETYNIDVGNNFDATWNNFCASGAGECIVINPTTCTFSNGLPVNHDVEGNTCIHGMINISEAIHLTPQINAPTNPEAGTMYFDASTAKLRIWDGGQWRECW